MVCLFVTLEIQNGKQKDLEGAFKELRDAVKTNEPGNVFYQLARDDKSTTTYHVLEAYTDQAALDAHGKSEHFRASRPKMGAILAGALTVKRMEGVI